jgi:hypothetical protein
MPYIAPRLTFEYRSRITDSISVFSWKELIGAEGSTASIHSDLKSFISGSFIKIHGGFQSFIFFVNSYSIVQLDPCSNILWDVS